MNLTDHTVCIPNRAVVAVLQLVTIKKANLEKIESEPPLPNVLGQINIRPDITDKQHTELMTLLRTYRAFLNRHDRHWPI